MGPPRQFSSRAGTMTGSVYNDGYSYGPVRTAPPSSSRMTSGNMPSDYPPPIETYPGSIMAVPNYRNQPKYSKYSSTPSRSRPTSFADDEPDCCSTCRDDLSQLSADMKTVKPDINELFVRGDSDFEMITQLGKENRSLGDVVSSLTSIVQSQRAELGILHRAVWDLQQSQQQSTISRPRSVRWADGVSGVQYEV